MWKTYLSVASSQQLLPWLGLSLLLMFAPPHMYHSSVKGKHVGKKRNPTSHGIKTLYSRMQGHQGKKKSCQNVRRQSSEIGLRLAGGSKGMWENVL